METALLGCNTELDGTEERERLGGRLECVAERYSVLGTVLLAQGFCFLFFFHRVLFVIGRLGSRHQKESE